MASAVVEASVKSSETTDTTTHDVSRPAGVAGRGVLIGIAFDGGSNVVITPPEGYALLPSNGRQDNGTATGAAWYYHKDTGSEGTSIQFTTDDSEKSAHICHQVSGGDFDTTLPEIVWNTVHGGTSSPNPPTISPAGGSDDYLFFCGGVIDGEEDDDDTWVNSAPTGYGNIRQSTTGVGGAAATNTGIWTADRQATTGQENPGSGGTETFSLDAALGEQDFTIVVHPGSQASNLTIADATHGHTADNIALTQHNVLAIQDANHGHTVDSPSLTQHNVLAIQDATHGHTVDSPSLTQHNVLAIQDASHGHVADTLALTQHNVLAIQDALHAHAADNVVLSSDSTLLVIQDALHAHTADNVSLIQHFILVIADALHGHAADNIALTQHNVLAIDDALHAHLADHIHDIGGDFGDTAEQNVVRLRRRKQPIGT